MQFKHNKQLVPRAKELRKNMTKEERHLWYDFLRNHPSRFVRQKVLGYYIGDFYSATAKLIIELDGSQHYEESNQIQDAQRTEFLQQFGLRVLRIPNNAIWENFRGVCEYIDEATKKPPLGAQGEVARSAGGDQSFRSVPAYNPSVALRAPAPLHRGADCHAKNSMGSTGAPSRNTAKCTWGAAPTSRRAVVPTVPKICPAVTNCPAATAGVSARFA